MCLEFQVNITVESLDDKIRLESYEKITNAPKYWWKMVIWFTHGRL